MTDGYRQLFKWLVHVMDQGYLKAALANSEPANATSPPKTVKIPKNNLIQNPGFEATSGEMPKTWRPRNYSGKANHKLVSPGRGGKGYAIMIESESGADSSVFVDVKVKKRTTYELTAWIKTEGSENFTWWKGCSTKYSRTTDQPRTAAVKGDKDWTRVSVRFKTDDRGTISINYMEVEPRNG